jgi:hypothetical protein
MSANPPHESDLAGRLLGLEKRYARLQAMAVFLSAAFALLLLWQLLAGRAGVSAAGFELRDPQGRKRAALMIREDGSPALRLNDRGGRARALLNVRDDGSAFFRLNDARGVTRARLALEPDGAPRLLLAGPDGRTVLSASASAHGEARLNVLDASQRSLWAAP